MSTASVPRASVATEHRIRNGYHFAKPRNQSRAELASFLLKAGLRLEKEATCEMERCSPIRVAQGASRDSDD